MDPSSTPLLVEQLACKLRARLIETHISWVLLANDAAYKIKKPVRLAFVDYRSLDSRRFFCEEELRLNARLAPSLYLGVSRVTGTPADPQLDGSGPVIDFAVRMRRFPDGSLFSELLQAGTLAPADVDGLSALLAGFHAAAPVADATTPFGEPSSRRAVAIAALEGAAPALTAAEASQLRGWIEREAAALVPLWTKRRADGRVREGHGDLHLANVVRLDGAVAAFDGIEFDPALRWIDVIDDLAFAVMDFCTRGRRDHAFRLLNGWLETTGDHEAVPALRFSVVYRALVRAQVQELQQARDDARRYIDTALGWTSPAPPRLFITHGLPGSGKTFRSQQLLEGEGAVRLRSDVERKRLFGLPMLADSHAAGMDLYNAEVTARAYERLFELARGVLRSGYPAIIDAAFLRRDERSRAHAVALEMGVPFTIVACEAPLNVLRERLLARRGDASEADVAVLERLRHAAEPLDEQELGWTGTSPPIP